jgi:hypothetical protein
MVKTILEKNKMEKETTAKNKIFVEPTNTEVKTRKCYKCGQEEIPYKIMTYGNSKLCQSCFLIVTDNNKRV